MAKVCMLVTNSVTNDPRVRREMAALSAAGHEVVVLGVADAKASEPLETIGDVVVRRTKWPTPVQRPRRPRRSPQQWLDDSRDETLRRLHGRHPRAYGVFKDLYVAVRYGGQLPASLVAAAQAAVAPPVPLVAPQPIGYAPPRPPTQRERLEIDVATVKTSVALNLDLARLAIAEHADVIHAHDLDTLLAGVIAKRVTGAKLVYDFHELYPHQHADGVKTRLWQGYYELLERLLVGSTDALITVNESLAAWNARTLKAPRALALLNVPVLQPPPTPTLARGGLRTVLYHGGYSPHRGLETLIESARLLRGARVVMRGVGSYEAELRRHVERCGVGDRVTFAPPVSMVDLVRSAQDADVGVIPYLPVCVNNYYSLPNKIFEYLMAGLAVVASDVPEIRRVVLDNEVGAVYDPHDARSLATAINGLVADDDLLESMRRRAARIAAERFNWEREQDKLLELYERLLAKRVTGSASGPVRTPGGPRPASGAARRT